ncbi:transcription initiation factor TFIID subunit 3 isoform X2 [Acanthochromis polyacanthus]|uniref:transcription initiation factor TFIID subunit 3 isoform X2 n=1 Tax=Acanthochromis polyacanthus TaxID=80966 RepID=UPI002234A39B|nr:transcription initiation factor TFIID subunit 3 isoform X2 [Acanthochromis polyacanthus]
MEEEGAINFKALRAKFQEEALLAQSQISRPTVAEKPKHIPPPGGHCSSVVSSINIAVENKTPVVPRVIFRDGLRASGGKRPISFPPLPLQTSVSSQPTNGDSTARQSLKDRCMPLVLPVLPVKDQKTEELAKKQHQLESEQGKEALPLTKIKKKGLLLPFKSTKTSKMSAESGEEPTYADLTNRPCSAPGELPSVEKQTTEDEVSTYSDQSTAECPLSSPDIPVTPPSAETSGDSDSRIMSTLERAKKKFSRQQTLISAKAKSLRSPDYTSRDKTFPSPPKNFGSELLIPPPVCLPHLACISARPFFKTNSSAHKPALGKQLLRDKNEHSLAKTVEAPFVPLKKRLPDLRILGSMPAKPPKPPLVDLSRYRALTVHEVSPGPSQTPTKEPASEHPAISNPLLDAPEFPEFQNSEVETAGGEAVDIASLEVEALDLVSTEIHTAVDFEVTAGEGPQPDLSACNPAEASVSSIIQDLNIGSQNIIPLDPASFPEPINLPEFPEPAVPEQWSHSKEMLVDSFSKSHSDETDLGGAECRSVPEERELSKQAASNDGIQTHPSAYQDDSYYETYDNVYEDVENVHKFIKSQNSSKQKGNLKNPYADNHPMEEQQSKWVRNPRGNVSGEHAHSAHNHIHSKAPQSPNAADHKEQRKREKQRLEKEKKEQKEREKKENEMKKKFKVTGEEEPMYHAKVMVASKVRKNDLPVKSGDTVSIIRTTNCPKGKWLARDANHKYGYISVMNVELNIKEMLELGKKAQAAGRGGSVNADTISIGSRSSNHPVLTSSFTDDSEEWACEDETLSPSNESHFPQQTASAPEMSCVHVDAQHTLSDANLEDLHTQTRHEALQKLAIFFQHNKDECGNVSDNGAATPTNTEPPDFLCAVEEPPYPEQEVDFTELELLPPPPLYADTF